MWFLPLRNLNVNMFWCRLCKIVGTLYGDNLCQILALDNLNFILQWYAAIQVKWLTRFLPLQNLNVDRFWSCFRKIFQTVHDDNFCRAQKLRWVTLGIQYATIKVTGGVGFLAQQNLNFSFSSDSVKQDI